MLDANMASLRTAARKLTQKSPNDVVVLAAVRSPVTRAFKGGFWDAYPEDILGPVLLPRHFADSQLTFVGNGRVRSPSQYPARRRERCPDRQRAGRAGLRENRPHGTKPLRFPELDYVPHRQPAMFEQSPGYHASRARDHGWTDRCGFGRRSRKHVEKLRL